jgi:hypothetical protein
MKGGHMTYESLAELRQAHKDNHANYMKTGAINRTPVETIMYMKQLEMIIGGLVNLYSVESSKFALLLQQKGR